MQARSNARWLPAGQLAIATMIWGGLFLVGKLLSPELPPMGATLGRYGFAAMLLLALGWRELAAVRREDRLRLAGLGLLSSTVFNGLVFFGLQHAPAGDAVLAPATVPILTTLAGALWLKQAPSGRKLLSLGLALAGLALVFSASLGAGGGGDRALGDAFHLGAAVAWSAYVMGSARLAGRYSPMLLTLSTAVMGTLSSLPLAILEGSLPRFAHLSMGAWLGVAYLSLVGSVVAFLLWSAGARALGPVRSAMFMNMVPIWGLAGSLVLLHEALGWGQVLGIAAVLGGVWGASAADRPAVASKWLKAA